MIPPWYSILDTEWPAVRTAIKTWLDPENFDAAGLQRRSLSAMTAAATVRHLIADQAFAPPSRRDGTMPILVTRCRPSMEMDDVQ